MTHCSTGAEDRRGKLSGSDWAGIPTGMRCSLPWWRTDTEEACTKYNLHRPHNFATLVHTPCNSPWCWSDIGTAGRKNRMSNCCLAELLPRIECRQCHWVRGHTGEDTLHTKQTD